ncbi:MAG: 6,7-dimethyl-8-ribityllumazine synthase [Proteobacteria bacterium]|nr:6,7-dimethyl-8-ribityllumazine synthase [Pseudomonadota bacterium]
MVGTKNDVQKKASILIIVASFNELVTKSLHAGALDVLDSSPAQVTTKWVPGCFELPVVAAKAARSGKYSAIITLGAVIRGETPHFDFVAGEAARGIMDVSLETGVPVIFGVLTTNTVEQALNRSGIKYGNKGRDAAHAALQMIQTMSEI